VVFASCSGKLSSFDYTVLQEWYDWIMENQKINVDLIGEYQKPFHNVLTLYGIALCWTIERYGAVDRALWDCG